ncbi:hypothetical protein [Lutibacter sp. Hel_I_33_5]|uniref:TlpA family protein disulfide reductase n=1 Tax=Lutibacter sp. Hel_I_33_5 TaxID=1566289 RepID=UPI00210576AD|nr:hypothetical protein [Lutibacter sp. Hel_I_33_5]
MALISCKTEQVSTYTYFGGKIINPKAKFVLLFKEDKVIDTLFLDNENKFIGTYDFTEEGLYYFEHGPESQYIYFQPKDSILIRLNTWEFDETLVFNGKGSERNNILIESYLETEKEQKEFYSLYKLSPQEFQAKTNSLEKRKLEKLASILQNNPNESDGFKELINVALTYPIYSEKERYPMVHSKENGLANFPKTDSNFYQHRKRININNNALKDFYVYNRFLTNYLYNNTYSLGHKPMKDEYTCEFTVDLLNTINDKFTYEEIKNEYLSHTVVTHFYRKSSCNVNTDAFTEYFKLSTSEKDKNKIKQLLNDSDQVEIGDKLSNFTLIDFNNATQESNAILKGKNSHVFFWNPKHVRKGYIVSKIGYLSKKYPNINFIQIKIDGKKVDKIDKLDVKNQFYIDTTSEANKFLTSKYPRSILVNKKGIVVNGYAALSSRKIYKQLEELSKH